MCVSFVGRCISAPSVGPGKGSINTHGTNERANRPSQPPYKVDVAGGIVYPPNPPSLPCPAPLTLGLAVCHALTNTMTGNPRLTPMLLPSCGSH